jgi:hypothetical protein
MYLYCPQPTVEVRTLTSALGATLVRRFDGLNLWLKKTKVQLLPGDVVVCWGETLPEFDGVKVLNSLLVPQNEYDRFHYLRNVAGVICPAVLDKFTPKEKALKSGYVPRLFNHEGGVDLLRGVEGNPDYYVQPVGDLTDECRVHIFNRRFLKFGIKVPRDGFRSLPPGEKWVDGKGWLHPKIRSWAGGWMLRYGEIKSPAISNFKSVAQSAIKHLQLTFATVDMALHGGSVVVMGVGLAPDLPEHSFIDAYSRWITKWSRGENEVESGLTKISAEYYVDR